VRNSLVDFVKKLQQLDAVVGLVNAVAVVHVAGDTGHRSITAPELFVRPCTQVLLGHVRLKLLVCERGLDSQIVG